MDDPKIHIDESTHERVPTTPERILHALLGMLLGFLLLNIVAFWMFPGIGIGGLYLISSAHPLVGFVGEMSTVIIYALLAICGVFGWFRGKYFTDRLKSYISWWKFW